MFSHLKITVSLRFVQRAWVLLSLTLAHSLPAIVLSWNDVTFVQGQTTEQNFDADDDGIDDVSISFTGDTGQFITFGGQPSPSVNDVFGDGADPNPNALALIVNFNEGYQVDPQSIRVTISFSAVGGVTGLRIPFYDVDRGTDDGTGNFSFVDQIRRVRTTTDGVQSGNLDLNSLTTLDDSTNSFTGNNRTIYGIASTTNDGAGGNFILDFGDTVIEEITFEYRSRPNQTVDDPANQGIGIGNIEFTPGIPEPRDAALLVGLFVGFFTFSYKRRPSSAS